MKRPNLTSPPSPIATIAIGFALFPLWSLTFVNPFEQFAATRSLVMPAFLVLSYWIFPLLIVFLASKRSSLLLPVFLMECACLFAHTIMTPIAASPYLQAARIGLLVALSVLGFLLMSRDFIFPLLRKGSKRSRGNKRIYLNHKITIKELGGVALKSRAMIENVSKTGMLITAPLAALSEYIAKTAPGDPIEISLTLPNAVVKIRSKVVWCDINDPMVRIGIHAIDEIPLQEIIDRSPGSQSGFIHAWERFLVLSGPRYTALALWVGVLAGTSIIPNCGGENVSGLARVGDAPEEGTASVRMIWDRGRAEGSFNLANTSYQIVSMIENCISGYTARLDWSESADQRIAIPEGDQNCTVRVTEIRLGSEIFVFSGKTYNTAVNGENQFQSSEGNQLTVANVRVLPTPVNSEADVEFSIQEVKQVEPVVVEVQLPEEACTIEVGGKGDPFANNVEFKIRVHPAYLPYARTLIFLPCGEGQQWDKCQLSIAKKIEYINKFRKIKPKDDGPYVVRAILDIDNPYLRNRVLHEGKALWCTEYYYKPK